MQDAYRPYDLLQGGFNSLANTAATKQAEQKAELQGNQPISPEWEAYIQELMHPASDPREVGQRAGNDPKIRALMQQYIASKKGAPQPGAAVPDVSAPGGQPTLSPPGSVSPSAGPGGAGSYNPGTGGPTTPGYGLGNMSGPNAVSGANPVYGAAVQRDSVQPSNPWAVTPQAPVQQGLGVQAQHDFTRGLIESGGPAPTGWMGTSRLPPDVASLGAPTPGAPQVSPEQAQQTGWKEQPGGGPQMPRQDFGQPQFSPDKHRTTQREFEKMAPYLPAMIASRGRENVAQTNSVTKEYVENLKAEKGMLVQIMKSMNVDDATQAKIVDHIEGQDISQQQFAVRMAVDLIKSQNAADATLGAARTRASTAESSDEKDLRNLTTRIQTLRSKTRWEAQPELKSMIDEFEAQRMALAQKLGKPYAPVTGGGSQPGGTAQPKPAPGPAPAGQKTPPPAKKGPAGPPAGKIKVKLKTGEVGYVLPAEFNPQSMQKL